MSSGSCDVDSLSTRAPCVSYALFGSSESSGWRLPDPVRNRDRVGGLCTHRPCGLLPYARLVTSSHRFVQVTHRAIQNHLEIPKEETFVANTMQFDTTPLQVDGPCCARLRLKTL